MMKLEIREVKSRSILTPQQIGSLSSNYDYSLNPYAGCAFACTYCYVPKFPGEHAPADWGGWVNVKTNAPELIRKDRLKVFGSRIFFSSATDPYQYIELRYRLSRRCLQELRCYQPAKLTMHTRSHLILQDMELLKSFGKKLKVGVSFTTNDERVRKEFEPMAPSLERRIELIKKLKAEGIPVYASIAPLLPCSPESLIALLRPHVDAVWVEQMRWPEVNNRPYLLDKYAEHFEQKNIDKLCSFIKNAFADSR